MGSKFFDADAVKKYLDIDLLINGLENGFVSFSTKLPGLLQPQRMVIPVTEKNTFLIKPVCSNSDKSYACKLLTQHTNNEGDYNLPVIQGVLTLFDSRTGCLKAVMDAISVTDIRTAAASAVAAKHLSKKKNGILAIVGTGHQAKSHIEVFRKILMFSEVRVFSRCKERREKFAEKYLCLACESVEKAVDNADVIVIATISTTPVLLNHWVKPGCFINSVGACFLNQRELDDEIMHNSQIFTDTTEGSYTSSGDVVSSNAKICGELGHVINGEVTVDWNRTRVFKSNGMAVQDLIAANIVADQSAKMEKGI